MIKAIEVIKMRKDIKHLIDKYFFSKSLLAEALEVCPKVITDLIDKEVMPQDDKFMSLLTKLDMIKLEIQRAEEYQPLHELLEKQIDSDWLQMQENILRKQNDNQSST